MGRAENKHIIFTGDTGEERVRALAEEAELQVLDFFESQKEELRKTFLFGKNREEQDQYLKSISPAWVFYPWNLQVIKTLPEKEFIAVRTSRNRFKITDDEQHTLQQKKVGVVGLSVGRTVSLTLALERACGELRMADFDTIELSNLNRLKTPLKDYGILKTTSTQREINEIDPYLEVNCFDEGLTKDNIDAFFTENGKLDLIIDECDSIEIKLHIRKKAKEYKVPVLMDTSDRGMIDIERYDLDENQMYFNGLIGDFDWNEDQKLSEEEKAQLLMQIIDFNKLSSRAKHSLGEIGKTISTWPQLASSVVLGGGATTNIARRILLGEYIRSGRYYVDLGEIIPDAKRR